MNKETHTILLWDDKPHEIKHIFPEECCVKPCKTIQKFETISKDVDVDVILMDLKHGDDSSKGEEYLYYLSNKKITKPIFVLSWTHSSDKISELINKGLADWYIHKGQLHQFNAIWDRYVTKILKIPADLKKYKKDMIEFITTVKRHSGLIWYGMKSVHLNSHGKNHSENLWRISDMVNKNLLYNESENSNNHEIHFAAFLLSLWLHDIGIKGTRYTMDDVEVRKYHGLWSAVLLEEYFDDYTFNLFKGNDELKKLTQIYSIYHNRKAPLDQETMNNIGKEKPDKYYTDKSNIEEINKLYKNSPYYIENTKNYEDAEYKIIKYYSTLLRLFDAMDFHINRVGFKEEKNIRLNINKEAILNKIESLTKKIPSLCKVKESIEENKDNDIKKYNNTYEDYLRITNNHNLRDKNLISFIGKKIESPMHYHTHSLSNGIEKIELNDKVLKITYDIIQSADGIEKLFDLFRECWKISNYVYGDFYPAKHCIKEKIKDIQLLFNINIIQNEEAQKICFQFDSKNMKTEMELKYYRKSPQHYNLDSLIRKLIDSEITEAATNQDTYYDFDNKTLYKNGFSLRKRETENNTIITIKVKPLVEEAFQSRIEFEKDLEEENTGEDGNIVIKYLSKFFEEYLVSDKKEWKVILEKLIKETKVEEIAIINTSRKQVSIKYDGENFTACYDEIKNKKENTQSTYMLEIEMNDNDTSKLYKIKKLKEEIDKIGVLEPTMDTKLDIAIKQNQEK